MVPICLAYVLGLAALAVPDWPTRLALLAGLVALIVATAPRSGTTALLIAAIAGLGVVRYATYTHPLPDDVSNFAKGRLVRVTGMVVDDSALVGRRLTTIVRVSQVECDGRINRASGRLWTRFYLPKLDDRKEHLPDYGDTIAFNCILRRPIDFGGSGSFSWPKYLQMQRIFAAGYSRWDSSEIEFLPHAGNSIGRAAHAMRHYLLRLINKRYPPAEAGTVAGILLGITTQLPLEDQIAFRRTGTYHLLAASGFNCLVIIIVFGYYMFPWMRINKRKSHLLLIAMLIFYAMISGGRPSIVRAATMASLYLLAFLMNRVEDSLNILATAALVILIARPGDFFDVGFRLSFAAAASIMVIAPLLRSWQDMVPTKTKGWRRLLWYPARESLEGTTATTSVTLGTLPLIAQCFNQMSLVSIPANAMVAFLALLIFVTACLSLAIGWTPVIGDLAKFMGVWVVRALLWIVRTLGSWEYASVSARSPGAIVMSGYYLLLVIGVWYASNGLASRKR